MTDDGRLLPVARLAQPRRGHFDLGTGYHGDLWLDLDALFLHPARVRPYVQWLSARLDAHQTNSCVARSRAGSAPCALAGPGPCSRPPSTAAAGALLPPVRIGYACAHGTDPARQVQHSCGRWACSMCGRNRYARPEAHSARRP